MDKKETILSQRIVRFNHFRSLILSLVQTIRPQQWSKNLLLFAGLIFSHNLLSAVLIFRSVLGFIIFCLLSGGVYIVNDLFDREKDQQHPFKRHRPIAAGLLNSIQAVIFAVVLLTVSLTLSFFLDSGFGMVCLGYVVLIIAYSIFLKAIVVLDVMIISIGFMLRAVAGGIIIHVEISPWLLVCTMFLALFLALSKRRQEIVLLGDNAKDHRNSLSEYNRHLLDQMIAVVTASTILAYALYTFAPRTIDVVGNTNLIFTIPFVIFGIFRYLYLVYQKDQGGNPEIVIFSDMQLIIDLILWLTVVVFILYTR